MRWLVLAIGLCFAAVADARPRGGPACIDSFGTVIEGVSSPAACKKLGARWGKPGTKSVPKDAQAKGSKKAHAGKRYAHRE